MPRRDSSRIGQPVVIDYSQRMEQVLRGISCGGHTGDSLDNRRQQVRCAAVVVELRARLGLHRLAEQEFQPALLPNHLSEGIVRAPIRPIGLVPADAGCHGQEVFERDREHFWMSAGSTHLRKKLDRLLRHAANMPLLAGNTDEHRRDALRRRRKVMLHVLAIRVKVRFNNQIPVADDQQTVNPFLVVNKGTQYGEQWLRTHALLFWGRNRKRIRLRHTLTHTLVALQFSFLAVCYFRIFRYSVSGIGDGDSTAFLLYISVKGQAMEFPQPTVATDAKQLAADIYAAYMQAINEILVAADLMPAVSQAYTHYMQVLQDTWSRPEVQHPVAEAHNAYLDSLRQVLTTEPVQQQAADAYRAYVRTLKDLWTQVDADTVDVGMLAAFSQSMAGVVAVAIAGEQAVPAAAEIDRSAITSNSLE